MSLVSIPFQPMFREAMLDGCKILTSRPRAMAVPGDKFKAFGAEFEVEIVTRTTVAYVAANLWAQEGCESEGDFWKVWRQIHPRRPDPQRVIFVHRFKRIK